MTCENNREDMINNHQMKKYIGTKCLHALPMTRGDYNDFRGWKIPEDENPDDAGYLVQYSDDYVSWSPAGVFEEAYYQVDGMNFGLALEAVKKGAKVARDGWNGKDMWVAYSPGSIGLSPDAFWSPANRMFAAECDSPVPVLPCLTMKTVAGEIVMGWLASQTDMLATDWYIVE